jgi:hypothetical protein
MTDRPAPIRITDLADPEFSGEARAMIAAMSALASSRRLESEAICRQATAETGLDDFGDEGFRDRLALLLRAFVEEADLSPAGIVMVHGQIVGWLKNRLLMQDLLTRHPQIAALRVERPIVVVGMPRSGTTHLHNLMSVDPVIRTLPFWEACEPFPPLSEGPGRGTEDPRRARCARGVAELHTLLPYFRNMHEVDVDFVEEEFMLMQMDLATNVIETMSLLPSYRDWYRSTDQTPHYAFLKRSMAALQWFRDGRWLLKCQQHLEQIRPVLSVFPDSTFVFTHRDPVAVVISAVTMLAYRARLFNRKVDPAAIGAYWVDRIEGLLRAVVRDHALAPRNRSLHVHFREFMADDIAMVKRIYACAAEPFTEEVELAMQAYMKSHPRGRFGRIIYNLADFDLDAAALRERFRFYTDYFDVDLESVGT